MSPTPRPAAGAGLYDRRMRTWLALPFVLIACAGDTDTPWPLGTPADVRTTAGAYDGYRVVMPCRTEFVSPVGVIGSGAVTPTRDELLALGRELFDAAVAGAYGDVVFSGGGLAMPCEAGLTTTLAVGDWRVVDQAIVDVAAWLRAHDLAVEVRIDVEGPAVPAAQ